VNDRATDAATLCRLIEKDPALTGNVLRASNSSFYKGLTQIVRLQDAVTRLGVKQIGALSIAVCQKKLYSASTPQIKKRLVRLWIHTVSAAQGCRWLARRTGFTELEDQAFIAGLLHDVGKVSLLTIIEQLARENPSLDFSETMIDLAVAQLYCEHGAELLRAWNLPRVYQDVVSQQRAQAVDESNILLLIVRLVDMACACEGISDLPDRSIALESTQEARILNTGEILLAELRMAVEDAKSSL
jgi:HD-like signal output (HDOD) protein